MLIGMWVITLIELWWNFSDWNGRNLRLRRPPSQKIVTTMNGFFVKYDQWIVNKAAMIRSKRSDDSAGKKRKILKKKRSKKSFKKIYVVEKYVDE